MMENTSTYNLGSQGLIVSVMESALLSLQFSGNFPIRCIQSLHIYNHIKAWLIPMVTSSLYIYISVFNTL